jgi:glycerol-3-phosphate cytidylyltransferase
MKRKKRVITYGTFDLFHKGHLRILERAREFGDYLIVGVTGESYDIERGKLNVFESLPERIENVKKSGLADEIIVEEYLGQKIRDIKKYSVDVLVIGSDWLGKFDYLKQYCDVVYLERTKNISSTQLRNTQSKIFRIGVVTEGASDDDFVHEAHFVSGLEISGVYSSDETLAEGFYRTYGLDNYFSQWDDLCRASDIIYVHTTSKRSYWYAEQAMRNNKHVIIDFPTLDHNETNELFLIAGENKVHCFMKVELVYLRTFQQLLWLLHGGIIGEVISIDCSIPWKDRILQQAALPVVAFAKILGTNTRNVSYFTTQYPNIILSSLYVKYDNAVSTARVVSSEYENYYMTIVGTLGRVEIPDKWWQMSYFEIALFGEADRKRYSFNIDGSGFRYLLYEMVGAMKNGYSDSARLDKKESLAVIDILKPLWELA